MTNSIVPSITDEQLADIEQYVNTTQRRSSEVENGDIAAIIARLREAEADAKRYRYMRASAQRQWRNGPGLYWHLHRDLQGTAAVQLDASIDAAMRESQP